MGPGREAVVLLAVCCPQPRGTVGSCSRDPGQVSMGSGRGTYFCHEYCHVAGLYGRALFSCDGRGHCSAGLRQFHPVTPLTFASVGPCNWLAAGPPIGVRVSDYVLDRPRLHCLHDRAGGRSALLEAHKVSGSAHLGITPSPCRLRELLGPPPLHVSRRLRSQPPRHAVGCLHVTGPWIGGRRSLLDLGTAQLVSDGTVQPRLFCGAAPSFSCDTWAAGQGGDAVAEPRGFGFGISNQADKPSAWRGLRLDVSACPR